MITKEDVFNAEKFRTKFYLSIESPYYDDSVTYLLLVNNDYIGNIAYFAFVHQNGTTIRNAIIPYEHLYLYDIVNEFDITPTLINLNKLEKKLIKQFK